MIPPALEQSKVQPRALNNCLEAGGSFKLNLGGRMTRIPGFLNVDAQSWEQTDIVADVSDLSLFADGTVNEIYASNVLEHFPHTQTLDVLKEWARVLAKGGKLHVSVPNFDALVEIYKENGFVDWVRNYLYGDQGGVYEYHYTCFTFATLAKLAIDAGFNDIKRVDYLPYGLGDESRLTDNIKFRPMALNAEVSK